MNILKRILTYLIWTIIAFLFAFGYVLIILGSKPEFTGILQVIFDAFYIYAFIYIVPIIGSLIALSFILIDIFYLKKRLKSKKYPIIIRLFIITGITILIGIIHYILEKVIDVI